MSSENLINQKNIKLNMSRRIRRTPFTNKVEELGVSDFTVVNHMLLPKGFKNTVEEDYWHLREQVQVWDVSCQRQVQITGPDAAKLVQKMTPRSIKKMETGKCFYIPIIDETAGMINDPVLLKEKYVEELISPIEMSNLAVIILSLSFILPMKLPAVVDISAS